MFQMDLVRFFFVFVPPWRNLNNILMLFVQAIRNPSVFILTSFNVLFASSSNLYLYCFGGMVVTDNALKYADIIFDSDWRRIPNDLQKYYIIMIGETQRPIYLDGYGIIRVSLEAFSKVRLFIFFNY